MVPKCTPGVATGSTRLSYCATTTHCLLAGDGLAALAASSAAAALVSFPSGCPAAFHVRTGL